ncbi:polyphosphate polymerase domain-containing protein, partial [Actinomyces sp. MRS3W]|uniref:polyphosphate polymerase domain-containing protein n=1 Tax=Actinomyces sp. MRS3W TaxID=2800796 RepID=UPI0028FD99B1
MSRHLHTSHLSATTLEALNAAAGLLTRVDRKYLLPLDDAQSVVDHLSTDALVLGIDGRRRFSYASTYFDTAALDSYLLAARKRRRRFKVRTRSYLDSGLCFLEVKTRGPRGATVKKRMPYALDDADRLTEAGRGFVADCLERAEACSPAHAREIAARLLPVMSTAYERTTLHLPQASARLTLDTNLSWTALTADASAQPTGATALDGAPAPAGSAGEVAPAGACADGLAIVETKNPATPSPADRLLWAQGHRPAKISKYATGMALLRPELPANKWHRVLTRELA